MVKRKTISKKFLFDKLQTNDPNFKDLNKIKFSEHHLNTRQVRFPSPFKKALILTLDGVGEWATTTLAIGNNNKIEMLKEIYFPHS